MLRRLLVLVLLINAPIYISQSGALQTPNAY